MCFILWKKLILHFDLAKDENFYPKEGKKMKSDVHIHPKVYHFEITFCWMLESIFLSLQQRIKYGRMSGIKGQS